MATQAAIRQRVFNNLYSQSLVERPFAHLINGGINSSVTAIVVDDGTNFAAGDIIEFNVDGEQCFVESVATNTLTVIRGYAGSVAASHSDNEQINKNPRFSIQQANDAINARVYQLEGQGIFVFNTGSLTLAAGQDYYDLTDTGLFDVLSVYYAQDTTLIPTSLPFRFHSELDSNVSTSGGGIHLLSWGQKADTDTLYYTFKQRIANTTDLLFRQEEIIVFGATATLLGATVGPRTHDSGRYTDRTVQPGQGGRDARWYQTEYLIAVREEQSRLKLEAKELPGTVQVKRARRWRA